MQGTGILPDVDCENITTDPPGPIQDQTAVVDKQDSCTTTTDEKDLNSTDLLTNIENPNSTAEHQNAHLQDIKK